MSQALSYKVYKGRYTRYYTGWTPIEGLPVEWWDQMGSYAIVCIGGVYNSFAVTPDGKRVRLSINKSFRQMDVDSELANKHLEELPSILGPLFLETVP